MAGDINSLNLLVMVVVYGKISGLSPVQTQNHTMTCSVHQHAFALCALRDKMCNKGVYRIYEYALKHT